MIVLPYENGVVIIDPLAEGRNVRRYVPVCPTYSSGTVSSRKESSASQVVRNKLEKELAQK